VYAWVSSNSVVARTCPVEIIVPSPESDREHRHGRLSRALTVVGALPVGGFEASNTTHRNIHRA
jgi:hypothetical protein